MPLGPLRAPFSLPFACHNSYRFQCRFAGLTRGAGLQNQILAGTLLFVQPGLAKQVQAKQFRAKEPGRF